MGETRRNHLHVLPTIGQHGYVTSQTRYSICASVGPHLSLCGQRCTVHALHISVSFNRDPLLLVSSYTTPPFGPNLPTLRVLEQTIPLLCATRASSMFSCCISLCRLTTAPHTNHLHHARRAARFASLSIACCRSRCTHL